MPECPDCAASVEVGVIFCPDCGREIPEPDPGTVPVEGEGASEYQAVDLSGATDATASEVVGERPPNGRDASSDEDVEPAPRTTDVDGETPFESGAVSFAIEYPVRDGYDAVVVGVICAVVPFLQPFVAGFGFRAAGAAARGQSRPPAFEEYGDLYADGLRVAALLLVYGAAIGAIGFLGFSVGVGGTGAGVVAALLIAGGLYLCPASLTAYAATRDVRAAFSPTQAGAFALSTQYVTAFALWAVLWAILAAALLVALFTVVGAFVVGVLATYFAGAYWGYYYREAVAAEVVPAPPDDVL